MSLEPDRSKVEAKIPLSASREPVEVYVCDVVWCSVVFKLKGNLCKVRAKEMIITYWKICQKNMSV